MILIASASLRVAAANNCLWFDEVWSVLLARAQQSPWHVFFAVNHSNNNHLNTLYLYFLGSNNAHWILYRLPSVLAGIGTVFLAGRITRRRSRPTALFAMLLTALSYPLIHFSSEARGYSLALFFDLLAVDFLDLYLGSRHVRFAFGFWFACIASLLSHLIFITLFPALILWSFVRLRKDRVPTDVLLQVFVRLYTVPCAAFLVLYLVDTRYMVMGGAPDYSPLALILETLSLAVGGPATGPLAWLAAGVTTLSFLAGIVLLRRRASSEWILYLFAILVFPLAFCLLNRSETLFVRYFLAGILFFLMLLSFLLAALWSRGLAGRLTVLLFLSVFIAGNARHTRELLRDGRGDYLTALQFMAGETSRNVIVYDSDHFFRNGMLVDFFAPFVVPPTRFVPVSAFPDPSAAPPPDWLIVHRFTTDPPPEETLQHPRGSYRLRRHFHSVSLSGWDWFLFQRDKSSR